LHQFATLFESVAPSVSALHLISDSVRKRLLGDFTGEVSDLTAPIAE
jgi:hypothetical protein